MRHPFQLWTKVLLIPSAFLIALSPAQLVAASDASKSSATTPDSKASESSQSDSNLLPADLLQISNTEAFSKYVFVVDKSARKLAIYETEGEGIKKIQEFPADIGKKGGNKSKANDHKTPEGIYFLQKNLKPPEIPFELYGKMAFTTSYPNIFDQMEGKTGSGIWLHAVPDTVPLTRGSRGCVVVRNEVITELANFIKLNETPILIFDKVRYISTEEHNKQRQEIKEFLNGWKTAWQEKRIDDYINFYDSHFSAPGFNIKTWRKHKERLAGLYKTISVDLSQPYILLNHNQLIVKTLQKYTSDLHTDFGIKTVYARKSVSGYRILREEWTAADEKGYSTQAKFELNPANLTQ